jgi:predicted amidophosphoribosyltransferase
MGPVDEKSDMAVEYHAMESFYGQQLAALVGSEVPDLDAVVSPPSSRPDATPYRNAVLRERSAHDLTHNFSRKGKVKVGNNDTTLQQAVDEMIYTRDGRESGLKSLLIVDESIASGKTVAAVLHHLRTAGLSKECKVTVVAWARVGP